MPYRPGDPAYYPVPTPPPPEPDDEAPDTDRTPAPTRGFYIPVPDCGDRAFGIPVPDCGDDRIRVPADIAPPSPRSQGGHVLPPTEPGR